MPNEIDAEFADWLLTRYATEIIDAVKAPNEITDETLRQLTNLKDEWLIMVRERIEQLPR